MARRWVVTLGVVVGIAAPSRREVEAAINAIGPAAGNGCRRARLTEG